MPVLIKIFIDRVVSGRQWDLLAIIFAVMIAVFAAQGIVTFLNTYLISLVGQHIIFDLRKKLYQKINSLSIPFFDRMKTGTLISYMMDDVNIIQNIVTGSTISIVTDILTLLVVVIVLLCMNWKLTFIVLAFLPLYGVNFSAFLRHIRKINISIREKMDEIISILHERISGVMVVKSFNREHFETREFVTDTRENLDLHMEANFRSISFSSIANTISGIGTSLILCLGGLWVMREKMTVGGMMMFASLSGYLFGPTARLTDISNTMEQVRTSLRRLLTVIDEGIMIREKPGAQVLPVIKGEIVFDKVCFHYVPKLPVLRDITFTIKAGETIAIVGPTGCGKTTIVNLLLRFYDPTSGDIYIDGYNLKDVTLFSLRNKFGIVPQDPVIFQMSILENIRYGNLDASFEEVKSAGRAAEIDNFIETLPARYEERIGEGGIKLSMGEKQRITIARAILANPSIIILDEATSSIDSESEVLIQQALSRLMKGRTSIVIAHRLSTIVNADRIIVMEKGRILETGNHRELMEKPSSRYRSFYLQQIGLERVV